MPVRVNVGPRDVSANVVEIVRRDSGEKIRNIGRTALANELSGLMQTIQKNLYERALAARLQNTKTAKSYDEFKSLLGQKNCFVEAFSGRL